MSFVASSDTKLDRLPCKVKLGKLKPGDTIHISWNHRHHCLLLSVPPNKNIQRPPELGPQRGRRWRSALQGRVEPGSCTCSSPDVFRHCSFVHGPTRSCFIVRQTRVLSLICRLIFVRHSSNVRVCFGWSYSLRNHPNFPHICLLVLRNLLVSCVPHDTREKASLNYFISVKDGLWKKDRNIAEEEECKKTTQHLQKYTKDVG